MPPRRIRETTVNANDQFRGVAKIATPAVELDQRVKTIGDPALALASRRINGRGKRALDLLGGLAIFGFVLPFLVTISLLLLISRRDAVFVRRAMIGRRGKPFQMVIFKTRAHGESGRGLIDRALETFAFNRLPALMNVIAGDMSLVGAAPVNAAGLADYAAERRYYLVARPGLTCPWQETEGARCAASCRDYVLNWRIRRDLATLRSVLLRGAKRT